MNAVASAAPCGQGAVRPLIPRKGPKPEHFELAQRIRSGDIAAAHELALANRGLIGYWVGFCEPTCRADSDDLEQEGYFTLVEAALAYDPERGAAFSTFASNRLMWRFFRLRERRAAQRRPPKGYRLVSLQVALDEMVTFHPASEPDEESPAKRLRRLIRRLPKRTRVILRLHARGQSFRVIAERFGVTHQRIQQIYAKAIRQLRERSHSE